MIKEDSMSWRQSDITQETGREYCKYLFSGCVKRNNAHKPEPRNSRVTKSILPLLLVLREEGTEKGYTWGSEREALNEEKVPRALQGQG